MPATSDRSGDVTAMSPGFHGRSLLTPPARPVHPPDPAGRRLRAGCVDSAEPRPRRYVMTVVTPRLPSPAAPSGNLPAIVTHDPCYKLMATFHKMKDEPGTEIVRCSGQGHAGHEPKQGQPDQRPAGGVGAIRRRSAAGLDPGNSQRLDLSCFGAASTSHWCCAPAGAVLENAARRGRRFGAYGAAADHIPSKWQDLAPCAMPRTHDGVCRQHPSRRACGAGGRAARPSGHPPQVG